MSPFRFTSGGPRRRRSSDSKLWTLDSHVPARICRVDFVRSTALMV